MGQFTTQRKMWKRIKDLWVYIIDMLLPNTYCSSQYSCGRIPVSALRTFFASPHFFTNKIRTFEKWHKFSLVDFRVWHRSERIPRTGAPVRSGGQARVVSSCMSRCVTFQRDIINILQETAKPRCVQPPPSMKTIRHERCFFPGGQVVLQWNVGLCDTLIL